MKTEQFLEEYTRNITGWLQGRELSGSGVGRDSVTVRLYFTFWISYYVTVLVSYNKIL